MADAGVVKEAGVLVCAPKEMSDGEEVGCWGASSSGGGGEAEAQLEYDSPEAPEHAKLLFGGPEAPLEVRPGAMILWAALLFASVFRQWAFTVLSQLYALSPDDYDAYVSVRGACDLNSSEYADIVYAYTVVAVGSMGVSGACATLFGARRTAAAGLVFQVAGCATCALAYGVPQLALGTVIQAAGYGIFLTPAYSLVFGIERSGKRRVLATTTVQAAGNLGIAAANMSIYLADSFVGWRGTYALVSIGLGASSVGLLLAPDASAAREEVEAPVAAVRGELWASATWMWRGRAFYGWAILASACCGLALTLDGTWIATYFLDYYPYYADLYAYLTASVITIGIGIFFLLAAGWLTDRAVNAAPFGVPTLLVVPGLALICGAPFKLIAVVTNDNFPLAFFGESVGKAFDCFMEAPLYVCLQLVSPAKHRPTVVGLFLFCYWVLAATLAELANDAFGLNLYQILMIACFAQAIGGAGYVALAHAEYPAALRAATEESHITGD